MFFRPWPDLSSVSHVKILGCYFSDDLKWNAFVDSIVKRASKRIYLLLCLKRSNCSPDLLFRAYCVYIRPILLYAFPAVCNLSDYLKRKLGRVEKRVLRIISDSLSGRDIIFCSRPHMWEPFYQNFTWAPASLTFFSRSTYAHLSQRMCFKKTEDKNKTLFKLFYKILSIDLFILLVCLVLCFFICVYMYHASVHVDRPCEGAHRYCETRK